jgi:hypothetical protein
MIDYSSKVIFLDIDGCLLKHHGGHSSSLKDNETVLLPGVKEKLDEWEVAGYYVVITTGRRECLRDFTIKQLAESGVVYDQLVMGLGRGERIVINDKKSDGSNSATAICIDRNEGIGSIEL